MEDNSLDNPTAERASSRINRFLKLPDLKPALIILFVVIGVNFLLFWALGSEQASRLGDTFGFAGAILTGLALFGVVLSLYESDEHQNDQVQLLLHQSKLIENQQEQISALAEIARAIADPVIIARVQLTGDSEYMLIIENIGKRSAYDVSFQVDPLQGIFPYDEDNLNLSSLPFIRNGLQAMAPTQYISAYIANGRDILAKRKDNIDYVSTFSITVAYDLERTLAGNSKRNREQYTYAFDIDTQEKTFRIRSDVAEELNEIRKEIEKGDR